MLVASLTGEIESQTDAERNAPGSLTEKKPQQLIMADLEIRLSICTGCFLKSCSWQMQKQFVHFENPYRHPTDFYLTSPQ